MTYQGHKNRNAWNVALYLANEEPLYRLCQDAMKRVLGRGHRSFTTDDAARYVLRQLPERTPDGVPYTFTNVRLALANWEG